MISTRSAGLLIDTVVCLTLAKWETVSGRFGGYLKLVIARCDPATVLDLVEEPFDQIAGSIQIWAKADRCAAIASRRDIGQRALPRSKGSDPVGIITAICQQHRPGLQARQQFAREPVVMGLAGGQREPHRQTVGIDHRMYLAGQPAA